MPGTLQIGLVGLGYWGEKIARNLEDIDGATLSAVCDVDSQKATKYAPAEFVPSYQDLLQKESIHAVIIATPVRFHKDMVIQSLASGKHVLVEKPLCFNTTELAEIRKQYQSSDRVCMIDHTYLYTEEFKYLEKLIHEQELGDLQYYDSVRSIFGRFYRDANVLWDLAPHDLSMLFAAYKHKPHQVSAMGYLNPQHNMYDTVHLNLSYPTGFRAHISCSWSFPAKERRIVVSGTKKQAYFNDALAVDKLKIYTNDNAVNTPDLPNTAAGINKHLNKPFCPHLPHNEALFNMLYDFVHCIIEKKQPKSGIESGSFVVEVLEAAEKSLREQKTVSL